MGWVQNRRDHGGCVFIDLRDREGITQVVFDPQNDSGAHELSGALRGEWVCGIKGSVRSRGENQNPRLPTGAIDCFARYAWRRRQRDSVQTREIASTG